MFTFHAWLRGRRSAPCRYGRGTPRPAPPRRGPRYPAAPKSPTAGFRFLSTLGLLVVGRPPTAPCPLDNRPSPAYTFNMSSERHKPSATPCLCNALRQAGRAVSRLYDEELRGVGLRT